jgi:hypothetical protein
MDAPALPASFSSGEVPTLCVAYAAAAFELPPSLILAVLKSEGGRVGMQRRNENGTDDLGPGMVNSIWLPVLKEHGIDRASLRDDGCLNAWVTTWILRLGINSAQSYWRGVGRYNSSTMRPGHDLNGEYARRTHDHYVRLNKLTVSWWGLPGLNTQGLMLSAPSTLDLLAVPMEKSLP